MLIIFDLDGTLFRTALCEISAVNILCDISGIERNEEKRIKSKIGLKTNDFLSQLLPDLPITDEIIERFHTLERLEISQNGVLFPHVLETLTRLREQGHELAICSNGSREQQLGIKNNGNRKLV